jgi:small subunit ribosomal protein S18
MQKTVKQNIEDKYIDYKNVELLKRFMNPHARMIAKKRTGIPARQQRMVENAIKHARFMALLPFTAH